MITFGNEKGWMGVFTRHHAEGAYANGLRVVKLREESGDITPLGTEGVILGSLDGRDLDQRNPDGGVIVFAYFVEWDNRPRVAIGTIDWKIVPA